MQTKRFFQWLFMAIVMATVSFSLTACSEDDDNGGGGGGNTEEASYDAYLFSRVASIMQATDNEGKPIESEEDLPSDWNKKQYTPTIGVVTDGSNERVRSLAVSGMNEAVEFFRSLSKATLFDTLTATYLYQDTIGSIHYAKVNDGTTYASIEFEIPQLKIDKLHLVTPDAIGDNGTFSGEPYYHIGDVVKDKEGCIWFCVRSAFSKAKVEHTHWVSFTIPGRKLKHYDSDSKHGELYITKDLGDDTRMLTYFAQLFKVMANPDIYDRAVEGANGQLNKGLGELGYEAYTKETVREIAGYWDSKGIWDSSTPKYLPKEQVKTMQNMCFLYGSMNKKSKSLVVPIADISGETMTTTNYRNWSITFTGKESFNVSDYIEFGRNNTAGAPAPAEMAMVVRIKNGRELGNSWSHPSATEPIKNVTPIYLYRNEHLVPYFRPGDVIKDKKGSKWICIEPSGNATRKTDAIFISFDVDNTGQMEAIPEKYAPRVLSQLINLYSWKEFRDNVSSAAKVNLDSMFVKRNGFMGQLLCTSIPYKGERASELLMRVVQQTGSSGTVNYRLFKHYTKKTDKLIELSDVCEQTYVENYQDDYSNTPFTAHPNASATLTKAYPKPIYWDNYAWNTTTQSFSKKGYRNIFNEPVMLINMRILQDNGTGNIDGYTLVQKAKANALNYAIYQNLYLYGKFNFYVDEAKFVPSDYLK